MKIGSLCFFQMKGGPDLELLAKVYIGMKPKVCLCAIRSYLCIHNLCICILYIYMFIEVILRCVLVVYFL